MKLQQHVNNPLRIAAAITMGLICLSGCSTPESISERDTVGQLNRVSQEKRSLEYNTPMGSLRTGHLFAGPIQLIWDGQKPVVTTQAGFIMVGPQHAYELEDRSFEVLPLSELKGSGVTLCQDPRSKKWLATDGYFGVSLSAKRQGFSEGQVIRIVGGESSPVLIGQQKFANTTVIIKDRKPQRSADGQHTNQLLATFPRRWAAGFPFGETNHHSEVQLRNGNSFSVRAAIRKAQSTNENTSTPTLADFVQSVTRMGKSLNAGKGANFDFKLVTLRENLAEPEAQTLAKFGLSGGIDLVVPARGDQSVKIPNGKYEIYLQYAAEPEAVYQGKDFAVDNNKIAIDLASDHHSLKQIK